MIEARQNWHRFRKLLGSVAPQKNGVLAVHSGNQIIAGGISTLDRNQNRHFSDQSMAMAHPESSWEVLAHKYQAGTVSFVEREALIGILADVQRSKLPYPRQLEEIRNQIINPNAQRNKLIQHFGERPVDQAWPRKHFFLNLFEPFFSDLLPERKILLLVIARENPKGFETIAIEFAGRNMRNFMEPEWGGLDFQGFDIFHRESAQRMVLWCENHFLLPCFGSFVTENVWEEALNLYMRQGARAAWRYWGQQRTQRESERELLVEPEPWPLKACIQWLGIKA